MPSSLILVRPVLTIFLCLQLAFSGAESAEMPKSWPWKGVVVNNITFTPEKLAALKKELPGINSIRLTLQPRLTAKLKHLSPADAWVDISAWTHKMLDACAQNGIVAIVSVHEFPVDPSLGIVEYSDAFWSSDLHRKGVISYVNQMSKEFASRGDELVAFEVLSEPFVAVNKQPLLPKEWPQLMREIVLTIRKNSNKWIVITPGPGGFARGYVNFKPLDDKRIVYGAHMYEPNTFALQGTGASWPIGPSYPSLYGLTYWDKNQIYKMFQPLITFQETFHVPVWIGEFSAAIWAKGSEQYLSDIIDISNSSSWGWAYFDIDGFVAWNPDYEASFPSSVLPPKKVGHVTERWHLLEAVLGKR